MLIRKTDSLSFDTEFFFTYIVLHCSSPPSSYVCCPSLIFILTLILLAKMIKCKYSLCFTCKYKKQIWTGGPDFHSIHYLMPLISPSEPVFIRITREDSHLSGMTCLSSMATHMEAVSLAYLLFISLLISKMQWKRWAPPMWMVYSSSCGLREIQVESLPLREELMF